MSRSISIEKITEGLLAFLKNSGQEDLLEDVITRLSTKKRVDPEAEKIALGFLNFLKKTQNIILLPQIIRKLKGSSPVLTEVTSAFPLEGEKQREVEKVLKEVVGNNLKIRFNVSPEILGGIKIKIDDKVLDDSLLASIESWEETW